MKKRKKNSKTSIPPFKIGEWVVTKFYPDEATMERRITEVIERVDYGSGWAVSADGGCECETCGKLAGRATPLVDSPWFRRIEIAWGDVDEVIK